MPAQRRGERRIDDLLRAAVEEFAAVGYEAATMSSIARRAAAPIGSLYQFFPKKEAVARGLRTRQVEDVQRALEGLTTTDVREFVDGFVTLMVAFVEGHPAFLPLLDAPVSTRPVGPRNQLRHLLAEKLRAVAPDATPDELERLAELVMELNRAMMGYFARKPAGERAWVLGSYRGLLLELLHAHAGRPRRIERPPARRPSKRKPAARRARSTRSNT